MQLPLDDPTTLSLLYHLNSEPWLNDEAYESADALLEHQQAIAEAKMKLFREFVDGHTMAFYDEPSPALAEALEGMGTTYERFSFFQGLEADRKVEVPA